jgi:hypothetical protein
MRNRVFLTVPAIAICLRLLLLPDPSNPKVTVNMTVLGSKLEAKIQRRVPPPPEPGGADDCKAGDFQKAGAYQSR